MKQIEKILVTLLVGVIMCILPSCGGGSDDSGYSDPNTPGQSQPSSPVDNGKISVKCEVCNGDGHCPTCHGTGYGCKACGGNGECSSCAGSGNCKKCDGSGKCGNCDNGKVTCSRCNGYKKCMTCLGYGQILSTVGKYITCPICNGRKYCTYCTGTGKRDCLYCYGKDKCDRCYGKGTCDVCKGKMTCTICGGDGHCSVCNNRDGKCTNCKGEGYLYYDYIVSPTSLEFDANGGSRLVSVNTKKSWSVSCNDSWIKIPNAKGSGSGSFTIEAEANTDFSSRSTTIFIFFEGKSISIPLTQDAAAISFSKITLADMLNKPLGVIDLDLKNVAYSTLVSKLSETFTLWTSTGDPWLIVDASNNPLCQDFKYHGMDFYEFSYMVLGDNSYDYIGYSYSFLSNDPDPYSLVKQVIKDFNDIGIPLEYNETEKWCNMTIGGINYIIDGRDASSYSKAKWRISFSLGWYEWK